MIQKINTDLLKFTLETRMNFLFEKWSEPYMRYGEVNLAKEKFIVAQEPLWSSPDCSGLAGKGGVYFSNNTSGLGRRY